MKHLTITHKLIALICAMALVVAWLTFNMVDRLSSTAYDARRDMLQAQKTIAATRAMAREADVSVIGIGQVDDAAPLLLDGFITPAELAELRAAGAVGEILGWVYDRDGRLIEGLTNARVSSVPLTDNGRTEVIAAASGPAKVGGILGAVRGGRITGLVTDEATAEALLA